jgi:hypothetical protein
MSQFQLVVDPKAEAVFEKYRGEIKLKLLKLRKLIIDSAIEIDGIQQLEETLKWGEPSYLTKKGSTIRIDWKPRTPNQYAIYFKCTSKLVETFKTVFKDQFNFEGNRAILFQLDESVPEKELKTCIK